MPPHTKNPADQWFGDLCVEQGVWGVVADGFVEILHQCGDKYVEKRKPIKEMRI